ncbi:MAG TPA: rod shape-determining protein MreC [Ruminococcaceae bacterium]|nr:rod shape-determining protein MreC [Oscillospiraceae bacterium]
MKNAFNSTGFKILVSLVFFMLCLMLYTTAAGGSLTSGLLGFFTTPMEKISTAVTVNAENAAKPVSASKEELIEENEKLKKQVDSLNKKLINYYDYKQENAQLKKYLGIKNENPDYKPVPATVIGRDPNDLYGGFTIDQGTQSGIAVNDPVITESGVVGWISSVNKNYGRVTTILSPDTKISAIDKANRETGVISCDIRSADSSLLKLDYLSSGTSVKAGDIIVTSGLGGIYPANLPIGNVKSVENSKYDVSLYAEVSPLVDVKNVRDVMVITSFVGQGQALSEVSGTGTSSSSGGK